MSRSTRMDTVFIVTCLLLLIQNTEQDIYVYKIVNDEYVPSYVQQRSYGTEIHTSNIVDPYPTRSDVDFYINPVTTQKPQRNPQKPVSRTPIGTVRNQQRRAQYPPDQFHESRDRVSYEFASADRNQVFPVSPVDYERTNVNLHVPRPTAVAAHRSEPTRTEATRTTITVFTNDYQQKTRTTTEKTLQHNTGAYEQVYTEKSTTRHAPTISDGWRSAETNASHSHTPSKMNDTGITSSTTVNVTVDERGSFEGACPTGKIRVKGTCQKPD